MENPQNPQNPQDPREAQGAPQPVPAAAPSADAPGQAAPTPPRRSHTVLTVLASAVAAVVLFAGGVLVGHLTDRGDGPRDPAGMSGDRVPGDEQGQHSRDGAPGTGERGTAPAPQDDATPDDRSTQDDRSMQDDGSMREDRSAPDSTDGSDGTDGTGTEGASALT